MADFHPSNQRPPKAKPDLVARISKIGSVSRCLEDALSDLIREDDDRGVSPDDTIINGSSTESKVVTVERRNECRTLESHLPVVVCEEFKTRLVETYGEAIADIDWDEQDLLTDSSSDTGTINRPTKKRCNGIACPSAAILLGTMTYYNRVGGQWRIVVSDGEIRRRVNFDCKRENRRNKKGGNGDSLWNQSERGGDVHEVVKFDSPLLILAYDDV